MVHTAICAEYADSIRASALIFLKISCYLYFEAKSGDEETSLAPYVYLHKGY